ncbi:LysR family transcriptional regulator [bacterium]|nr:LysR family transcriptional regulator [bacterium]
MANQIDLNKIYVFRAVVRAGSITKAAQLLKQPKSNVSRQLSTLEEELGMPLVLRTTRHLSLTSAGKELNETVLPYLNEIEGALDKIKEGTDEVAGRIRITVPEDIGIELMGGITKSFQSMYPQIVLETHVGNRWVDLIKESFDMALRIGRMNDSTLIQKKIGMVSLGLYLSPSLKMKTGVIKKPSDISDIPYLAFSPNPKLCGLRINFHQSSQVKSVKLRTVFTSNSFFCLRDLAIKQGGMAVLPSFMAERFVQSGDLVRILRDWEIDTLPMHVLIPHQKDVPLRTRKFIEHLQQGLMPLLS